MTISEKVAYLKGLAEGLELDTAKSKEAKLISVMIGILEEVGLSIEELEENAAALEEEIDAILLGQSVQGLQEVIPVVERCAQEFVSDLLSALRERQLELRTAPVVFVGGGSILLKRHIEKSGKVAHPLFVEDIRANVKGYETLYRIAQNSR